MRYFDLHCDTITECYLKNADLFDNNLHWSLKRAKEYNPLAQVFAIWIPDEFRGDSAVKRFEEVYNTFIFQMTKHSDRISFCRNAAELKAALSENKAAALLSIEGGAALGGKIENLDIAYNMGVRIMTLTWNGRCEIGDGVMSKHAKGLTEFGVEVVRRMEQLGMIVDVSHLSEKGFWNVAEIAAKPFIASHSNSKEICSHKRNLTDEQFTEIKNRGGIVGINLYRGFLRDRGKAYIKDVKNHIEHFLSLGGENVLAIGGDLDGSDLPYDMNGVEDVAKIYDELLKSFSEQTVNALFFDNAYRFFENNL